MFILCKFWIFIIPTIWYLKVDNNIFSRSLPTIDGLKMGTITGVGMSIIIIITWLIFENSINLDEMKVILESQGLSNFYLYVFGMIYWIFINSLLEEYVFRWFITTKASILFGNDYYAIIFSAFLFTLHHAIALYFFGFIFWQIFIASFGLLTAAAIWSWLYLKYESIWVCWLSHAICDIVVFSIGFRVLFM